MKWILIFLFSVICFSASAQISFKTGSVQLDTDLNTINVKASADFNLFKSDLSVSYNVSEQKIEFMKGSLNMVPGEIYLSLEIAKISKTPVDEVITIYKNNKSKGWGYIAKQAGIKPGSAEFHQLKNSASSQKSKKHGKNNGNGHGKGKNKK